MALILSLETSTQVCSVAFHDQGKLSSCQSLYVAKSHAESLLAMIAHLFTISPYSPRDLVAVAISQGPGSYTGLRIGTATAKGLCYALEIPLIAVNTLEAMAYSIRTLNLIQALICPMIDARRMEVYYLLASSAGHILEETQACEINAASFQPWLKSNKILFLGDGAAKCKPLLAQHQQAIFIPDIHPSAEYIGALAYPQFQEGNFVALADFEPLYLKPFQGKLLTTPTAGYTLKAD